MALMPQLYEGSVPNFHRDFLRGRSCLIGCPKFDNTDGYINKFTDIFKATNIKSITVLIMEVPCCSKLPAIIQEGMGASGKKIPLEVVTVSTRGNIIERKKL